MKNEFMNMATPISGFESIEKCLGGDGKSFDNQKCKSLEELYENVQKFRYSFPKEKLKNTPQLCQKDVSKKTKDIILNINKICYFY